MQCALNTPNIYYTNTILLLLIKQTFTKFSSNKPEKKK